MNTKEKILYVLILLFFVTLFFAKTISINVVLTGAIVVFSYFWNSIQEKWELLKARHSVQFMLLFFGFELLSFAFSQNTGRGLHYLKLHLPLLLYPASIGLITMSRSFKDKILLSFAIITTLICVLCLGYTIFQYNLQPRSDLFYNDNLTKLLNRQSIYIALAVNVAIYIFGYFIVFKEVNRKFLMLLAVVFLFLFSYLLASRINLAVLALVSIGFSIYYIFSRKKILEGVAFILGIFIAGFLVQKFFPNTINRYKELTYSQFNFENQGPESHFNVKLSADQWNGANFRLAAWTCGWEVFKENPLFGTKIGDKEAGLLKKYEEKNFHFAIKTDKNVHNNYLDILFSLGFIGFMLFLLGWLIFPVISALRFHDYLSLLIILTFALAWVSEVYFSRNFGAMIAGFFIPFLLSDKMKKAAIPNADSDFLP